MERAKVAKGAGWLQWRKVASEKRRGKRQRRREGREGQQRDRRRCMSSRPHKEQLGKVSSEAGTARKVKTKKRTKE